MPSLKLYQIALLLWIPLFSVAEGVPCKKKTHDFVLDINLAKRVPPSSIFNVSALSNHAPRCWNFDQNLTQPLIRDCNYASLLMQLDHQFTVNQVYGHGTPGQGIQRSLPIKYSVGTCVILFDVEDRPGLPPARASFSLKELYDGPVRKVRRTCIKDKPQGEKFGGFSWVGDREARFFVLVQSNFVRPDNGDKGFLANTKSTKLVDAYSIAMKGTGAVNESANHSAVPTFPARVEAYALGRQARSDNGSPAS